jgi:hypothetical protein
LEHRELRLARENFRHELKPRADCRRSEAGKRRLAQSSSPRTVSVLVATATACLVATATASTGTEYPGGQVAPGFSAAHCERVRLCTGRRSGKTDYGNDPFCQERHARPRNAPQKSHSSET